jgi:outer membrane protein assembly factor BamB
MLLRQPFRAMGILLFATFAAGADWPQFRGNATQTGVASEPLPAPLVERWKFKLGADKSGISSTESTAAIAGGLVFVGAFDDHVHALDLATGAEKWKLKTGPIKAPLAAHGGMVYAGNMDGVMHCIDASTGKARWQVELSGEITSGANVLGDTILVGCGDETLQCLSKTDGAVRWKFAINGGPVMGTPALADGKTFAAGCDSTLHILNAADGKELGTVDLGGQVGAAAAVRDNKFYVGTMSSQVLAVDLAKAEVAWSFEAPKRKLPFFASVAATEKLVISGSRDKRVYALDRATGKEVWSVPTDGKVDSSPVVAGDRVYVGSYDGRLYVLDLATGKELQRIQLDGPVSASPAASGGCLVIGTEKGTVYCFGAAK